MSSRSTHLIAWDSDSWANWDRPCPSVFCFDRASCWSTTCRSGPWFARQAANWDYWDRYSVSIDLESTVERVVALEPGSGAAG